MIARDDRERVKWEINNEHEPIFLSRDKKGKGFLCPKCPSGSGKKGTGISQVKGSKYYHCHACGLTEDVIGLWQIHSGMTGPENFLRALEECAKELKVSFKEAADNEKPLTPEERARMEAEREKRRAEVQAQIEQAKREAAELEERKAASRAKAEEIYNNAEPVTQPLTGYLARKFVGACPLLRRGIYHNPKCTPPDMGAYLLPVWDSASKKKKFNGLQYLLDEPVINNETGEEVTKPFHYGTITKGGYCPITLPKDNLQFIYLAEGYATAYTVAEMTRFNCAVAVAFNCGNLPTVHNALQTKTPQAQPVIAYDNDIKADRKDNPGKKAAQECKGAFLVGLTDETAVKCGSDWNDLVTYDIQEQMREYRDPSMFITDEQEKEAYRATAEKEYKRKAIERAAAIMEKQLKAQIEQKAANGSEPQATATPQADVPTNSATQTDGKQTQQATAAPMNGQTTDGKQTAAQGNALPPITVTTKDGEVIKPKTELQKLLEEKPQTIKAVMEHAEKCAAMGMKYERALRALDGDGLDLGLHCFKPYGVEHTVEKLLFDGATIIAARTNNGKTLTMINLAARALKLGHKVLFLSLEEKPQRIFDNVLLSYSELMRGDTTTNDTARLLDRQKLKDIYRDTRGNEYKANDKTDICARNIRFLRQNCYIIGDEIDHITTIKNAKGLMQEYIDICKTEREKNPESKAETIIFLDYFQKLRGIEHKEGYSQMAECVDALTPLKNQPKVHLIAGVQLNRDILKSITRKADGHTKAKEEFTAIQKEDIREAADIEHFAELILFTLKYAEEKDGKVTQHFKVLKHRGDLNNYTMQCTFDHPTHFLDFETPSESDLGLLEGETPATLKGASTTATQTQNSETESKSQQHEMSLADFQDLM